MDDFIPKLPDHKPEYQSALDALRKTMEKRHAEEVKRHAEISMYPPKGKPWIEVYNAMMNRHESERQDQEMKEKEYQKVKDILSGKVYDIPRPDPSKEPEPVKDMSDPEISKSQEKLLVDIERQKKLREVQESLEDIFERKHKGGLSMGR